MHDLNDHKSLDTQWPQERIFHEIKESKKVKKNEKKKTKTIIKKRRTKDVKTFIMGHDR